MNNHDVKCKNKNFPRDHNDLAFVILPVSYFPLKSSVPVYLYNINKTTAAWHNSDSDISHNCTPSTRASSGAWRLPSATTAATASRWSSPAARPSPSRGRTDEFYVPVKTSKGMSESLLPLLQANVVIYHLYIRIRLEFILCRYRLI